MQPTISIPIHWGDMDALGHVNNVMFFRYLESARVNFIVTLAKEIDSDGADSVDDHSATSLRKICGVGFILQHVQCRFRRPLFYPDTITVTSRVVGIEADRFSLEHEITSQKTGEVSAVGVGTIVTYDYDAGTKVTMPERLRRALSSMK